MGQEIIQVDSFTDKKYSGNPAAVCLLGEAADENWMQAVAREMNLSETAFLFPDRKGYNLRWFTPLSEVDLCGHATLASAHVLFENGHLEKDEVALFYTRSGELKARLADGLIEMDFPVVPVRECNAPNGLIEALGVKPRFIGHAGQDYLVEVDDEDSVRSVMPDFNRLAKIAVRCVIVTSKCKDGPYDFITRVFAPSVGVNEDPATGSVHCALGPFWEMFLGKNTFAAYQASSRGGVIHIRIKGDRVLLSGNAITVMRAELV